jgi:hypothetical protein
MHVTIGLFEVMDISDKTMVFKLKELLDRFSLTQKIVVYVKDEGQLVDLCKCPNIYCIMH